jgi:hypothetical protein
LNNLEIKFFSRKNFAYCPYDEQQEPAAQPVTRQFETTATTPTPPQYADPIPQLIY